MGLNEKGEPEEFFVHHSQIGGNDLYKYLNDGEFVTFEAKDSTNGKLRLATNIMPDTQTNEVKSGTGS